MDDDWGTPMTQETSIYSNITCKQFVMITRSYCDNSSESHYDSFGDDTVTNIYIYMYCCIYIYLFIYLHC